MGEKFLQVFAGSDIFEEISDLLDEVAEANLPIVRELLNDKNVLGRTPWTNMIDDAGKCFGRIHQEDIVIRSLRKHSRQYREYNTS